MKLILSVLIIFLNGCDEFYLYSNEIDTIEKICKHNGGVELVLLRDTDAGHSVICKNGGRFDNVKNYKQNEEE